MYLLKTVKTDFWKYRTASGKVLSIIQEFCSRISGFFCGYKLDEGTWHPGHEESIRLMAEQFPEMLVGAGTVLTTEQVDAAVGAGAKFIVSPGFNPEIVDYCLEKDIPVFPGCITPSEVAQAVKRGLKVVKFFPAEPAGGISMIKAMAAPYTGIRFMPTGGINAKNLEEYLSCDKILCCGGSWMVKGDLVKAGEFDKIKELTAEARKLADSIRK